MAVQSARMPKEWNSLAGIALGMTASNTFLGSSLAFNSSYTVLRMLGEYVITPTSSPQALDNAIVTVGIGVVSSDAYAVGASAVPDPASEPNYPWLYWASHPFFFGATGADPASEACSVRHSFDVRSMRKLKARESLALVVEYADIAGTPALKFTAGSTRVLLAS
jgi:hypothetical protein